MQELSHVGGMKTNNIPLLWGLRFLSKAKLHVTQPGQINHDPDMVISRPEHHEIVLECDQEENVCSQAIAKAQQIDFFAVGVA